MVREINSSSSASVARSPAHQAEDGSVIQRERQIVRVCRFRLQISASSVHDQCLLGMAKNEESQRQIGQRAARISKAAIDARGWCTPGTYRLRTRSKCSRAEAKSPRWYKQRPMERLPPDD